MMVIKLKPKLTGFSLQIFIILETLIAKYNLKYRHKFIYTKNYLILFYL